MKKLLVLCFVALFPGVAFATREYRGDSNTVDINGKIDSITVMKKLSTKCRRLAIMDRLMGSVVQFSGSNDHILTKVSMCILYAVYKMDDHNIDRLVEYGDEYFGNFLEDRFYACENLIAEYGPAAMSKIIEGASEAGDFFEGNYKECGLL